MKRRRALSSLVVPWLPTRQTAAVRTPYTNCRLSFLTLSAGHRSICPPPYTADDSGTDPDISSGAEYNTVVSYSDKNQFLSDVPWTIDWLGNNGGDNLLEAGEKAEITVWLLVRDTAQAISSSTATSYWDFDENGAVGMRSTGTILSKHDQFTLKVSPLSAPRVGFLVNR